MILLLHGGAGKTPLTSSEAKVYRTTLVSLLSLSQNEEDISAEDRVIENIVSLEKHPLFNAGVGAALARDGLPYLDASLATSDGRTGAIASSLRASSAIRAAQLVMNKKANGEIEANFLVGRELDQWLMAQGQETSVPETRVTKRSLRRLREEQRGSTSEKKGSFATVGAVALDNQGRLAAATSTGGTVNKIPGRVGDSAIIGAGTYCSESIAISFTGQGEGITSRLSALRIALQVEGGVALKTAVEEELAALERIGSYAGCIALLASGENYIGQNSPVLIAGRRDEGGIWINRLPIEKKGE